VTHLHALLIIVLLLEINTWSSGVTYSNPSIRKG